ncbi:unnamed protein product [Taenia asiatica]|uniref:Uncharacterized protein n=1 Tax=Taenia asiatica TaxID=60517 RepID=A0A3P6Q4D0_TAEAS|nr:unnamed protein product [Taenia asiatica]
MDLEFTASVASVVDSFPVEHEGEGDAEAGRRSRPFCYAIPEVLPSIAHALLSHCQVAAEEEVNPFWLRLASQSRKQTALTIGVLVASGFVFLSGLGLCIYLRCSRRRRRVGGGGHSKRGKKHLSGLGGSYRILFNSEGEEPLPNGNNTLF